MYMTWNNNNDSQKKLFEVKHFDYMGIILIEKAFDLVIYKII